jgi:KUP system potassium uptake protein
MESSSDSTDSVEHSESIETEASIAASTTSATRVPSLDSNDKALSPKAESSKALSNPAHTHSTSHSRKGFLLVCLSALGVVYGDIGTSPLYVLKSVFSDPPSKSDVVDVISLIFWALTLVVCVKYLIFVMRADYLGEGGVFALLCQILYGDQPHDGDHHEPLETNTYTNLKTAVVDAHHHSSDEEDHARSLSESKELELQTMDKGKEIVHEENNNQIRASSEIHTDNAKTEATDTDTEKPSIPSLQIEPEIKQQPEPQAYTPPQPQPQLQHNISMPHVHEVENSWIAKPMVRKAFVFLAMVGSGLLLGDGVITPAISVLSAVEGLTLVSDNVEPAIVPITCVILILLFAAQRFGTSKVGIFFGPIMLLWFFILAAMGIGNIIRYPGIFEALNPYRAISFFIRRGEQGWVSLGAVVLCITGCEAMFADMGHFGKNAVRISWMFFVYPALVLNYLGQGALLILEPETIVDPFFNMTPRYLFFPIFIVSIFATVIASQALISGAFSLTQQAVRLGYFPRLQIVHTSAYMEGQIYIPAINYLLMVCGVILVAGFQSSEHLASAYGLAVCGDMLLTSFMFLSLARFRWRWHVAAIVWLCIEFFVIDVAFLTSNLLKVPSGGWFPLLFAFLVFVIMFIWYKGERVLHRRIRKDQVPFKEFVEQLSSGEIGRCKGVGIFMSAVEEGVPSALTQFIIHMPVLPQTTVFLTLKRLHAPYVPLSKSRVIALPEGCIRVVMETGFMENKISIEELSEILHMHGIDVEIPKGTFFLGNEQVTARKSSWIGKRIVVDMYNLLLQYSHSSTAATFRIPPKSLVYVGSQYAL